MMPQGAMGGGPSKEDLSEMLATMELQRDLNVNLRDAVAAKANAECAMLDLQINQQNLTIENIKTAMEQGLGSVIQIPQVSKRRH